MYKNSMRTFDKYDVAGYEYCSELRKERKLYKKGKQYIGKLKYLSIGKVISDDNDNEIDELIVNYLNFIKFKRNKRIENIDNDSMFINEGFYFNYKNRTYKLVTVYGQGAYTYVERIK